MSQAHEGQNTCSTLIQVKLQHFYVNYSKASHLTLYFSFCLIFDSLRQQKSEDKGIIVYTATQAVVKTMELFLPMMRKHREEMLR